jgi:hypothetical protein
MPRDCSLGATFLSAPTPSKNCLLRPVLETKLCYGGGKARPMMAYLRKKLTPHFSPLRSFKESSVFTTGSERRGQSSLLGIKVHP